MLMSPGHLICEKMNYLSDQKSIFTGVWCKANN